MNANHKNHHILALLVIMFTAASVHAQFPTQWTRDPANPVLTAGGAGAWDSTMAIATTVLYHDGLFKMWYEGNGGFGYATSLDGWTWDKHPGNPVFVPGPAWYDELEMASPSVCLIDGLYHMWYSGEDLNEDNRISHATSTDGIVWQKDPANPVMNLGAQGAWDERELIHPFVLYEEPLYRMWYNGVDGLDEQRIVYAESMDGVNWDRYPDWMLEVGPSGDWDDGQIMMACVVRCIGSYQMFYTAWNTAHEIRIGYASSPDGLDWTKRIPSEPVLGPGDQGTWDEEGVAAPFVSIVHDTTAVMYYGGGSGTTFETGIATSTLAATAADDAAQCRTAGLTLLPTTPNLFRPPTTIHFRSSMTSSLDLEVHDIAGRLVRNLIEAQITEAGHHQVIWNGRDDAGNPVDAGAYFYRINANDESVSKRVLLLK